jgi:hypothetical protein
MFAQYLQSAECAEYWPDASNDEHFALDDCEQYSTSEELHPSILFADVNSKQNDLPSSLLFYDAISPPLSPHGLDDNVARVASESDGASHELLPSGCI